MWNADLDNAITALVIYNDIYNQVGDGDERVDYLSLKLSVNGDDYIISFLGCVIYDRDNDIPVYLDEEETQIEPIEVGMRRRITSLLKTLGKIEQL